MKEELFNAIKDNLKNPKFYVVILILIFVLLLLFPYIDANFFYYDRVEKRVNILREVSEISQDQLENNPILEGEYQSILQEIGKQRDGSIGNIFILSSTPEVRRYKFISGAIPLAVLAILCIFIPMDRISQRIIGFIAFGVLGAIMGYVSQFIPTIIRPSYNYILVPLLQFILLGILLASSKNKDNTSE